ncbi:Sulfate/thiosulfate import ATP-binding protein CysA [Planctomycetes bacterium CA13]|uniref:Sulfate/thiosulfate import ATP-binding protein CysA n=1 Tax=Novipirellula herctigrandis TaxID=2527986 RepID=A0A5C5Z9N3_9BACT|nr:Sulfate/thiosulfate import ATP-binding protein CysA [Planctomycetes bacterium CA13]
MIVVDNITVHAGDFVLRDVSFKLNAGEYGALMGRTGCGKTTLLEAIIGLKQVQGGAIQIGERDVTHERPAARGIGYVPQDGALFSTMTVRDHLAFALEIRRLPKDQIQNRVDELAQWLGIEHLLTRRPFGLSGGERQRVAMGRALSFYPAILLLDEPLSAVDEETRGEMYELLRRVQKQSGVTVLHVTHNAEEAREMADVVFVLRDGKIQKEGA